MVKDKTLMIKESELERRAKTLASEYVVKQAKRTALTVMLGVLYALRDNHGFGEKRLKKAWDDMDNVLAMVNRGEVDLIELYETLKDEVGLNITELDIEIANMKVEEKKKQKRGG
jgi:ABC-type molybdate transport system substrate-binding protein